ncbi:MAG TPA: hypothetical protein DDW61_08925 [Actinobacteria bacterium]|nr:hypothetical protein [Actinomycetota bacterium]
MQSTVVPACRSRCRRHHRRKHLPRKLRWNNRSSTTNVR